MDNGTIGAEDGHLMNIDDRLMRPSGEGEIRPVIEIATYAGVDVYECYCRGQESRIVMRRCMDNWVNITQVFKIASFSKTQRTKILEKESNMVKHEKIQGGYGRFQGTWIPLENAHYLVQKYSVSDLVVSTILHFQLDPRNPPMRRSKNSVIKRQSPGTKIQSPSSYNKTPKKGGPGITKKQKKKLMNSFGSTIQTTAVKKAQPQPSPLQNLAFQTPQHQQHHPLHNNSTVIAPDQQTPVQPPSYETTQKPLQFFPYPQQQPAFLTFDSNNPHQQHSAKRSKKLHKNTSSQFQAQHSFRVIKQQFMGQNNNLQAPQTQTMVAVHPHSSHKASHSNGSNGSNGSSIECFSARDDPSPISSRSISPKSRQRQQQVQRVENDQNETHITEDDYKELLLQVLSSDCSANGADSIVLPDELFHPPPELDINFTIDDQGHTTLHWAAAMANIPLLKVILTLPVNILLCNHRGFNTITKACFYNNCYKAGVFPKVLELLKPCIITPDMNGRLPLHYLVELSVNKSKDPVVINYYLDSLLDALAQEDISLLRMCLNYQDNSGNTVLHLAALNLNLELCNKLCYLGSSMDILNLEHETATSILAKFNLVPPTSQQISGPTSDTPVDGVPQQPKQLKLSTPVMTRKKNGSFVQSDEHTIDLTQELSTISSDPTSFVNSSRIKSPKDVNPLPAADPLSVSSTVAKNSKTTPAVPIIKLDRARSSQLLTKQLSHLTTSLTSSVDEEISGLELEKEKTQECIGSIDGSLKHNEVQMQELLQGLSSKEELQNNVSNLTKQVNAQMLRLASSIEKSQALALATLVHEEEDAVTSSSDALQKDPMTSPVRVIGSDLLRLGLQLTLLQFGRKCVIEKLARSKSEINSTPKVKKYRKLIGLTIDEIDTKLDDIEKDLRASV